MDINFLWGIFVITIILFTLITVGILVPVLLQLNKTLVAIELLTNQWNKDLLPAVKQLTKITLKADKYLKILESKTYLTNKLSQYMTKGIGWVTKGSIPLVKYLFKACGSGLKNRLKALKHGNKS